MAAGWGSRAIKGRIDPLRSDRFFLWGTLPPPSPRSGETRSSLVLFVQVKLPLFYSPEHNGIDFFSFTLMCVDLFLVFHTDLDMAPDHKVKVNVIKVVCDQVSTPIGSFSAPKWR